jgi:hypothetical protein
MDRIYQAGQEVTVRSSQGILRRVVVADLGEVITICRHDEYERAKAEGREPAYVGFKKTDVMDDD